MSSFPFIAPHGEIVEGPARPTVSVLIPCFDAAATIANAVASALDQTVPPLEVIVCDDGSRDDPERALHHFGATVRLLRKQNGGGASALNHAVAVASGDLVAVLDADDVYDRRRIEALSFLAAVRPDLDIVTTDAWLERDGARVGRYSEINPFAAEDQRAAILETCFVGGWPAVRRRQLLDHGGWDESYRIAYDWACWLGLILAGARAGMVAEPLMSYRVRSNSLSADTLGSLRERIRLLRAVDRRNLSPGERSARDGAVARAARRLRQEEIAAAKREGARTQLVRLACDAGTPWRSRVGAVRAAIGLRRA